MRSVVLRASHDWATTLPSAPGCSSGRSMGGFAATSFPRARTTSFAVTDHVSCAAHGVQQRLGEALVDLRAQPRDVDVDDVGLRIEVIIPDVLQQHGAGDHLAGVLHEI